MSIIQIQNLTFAYGGSEPIFENVNFNLDTDWRLGLVGRNGRGKTTFLRLLCGDLPYRGRITATVGFEYFPYVQQASTMARQIALIAPTAEEWQIYRELNALNLSPELLYRDEKTLSGGERVKLCLLAMFLRENAFLLIDEPTNHLDEAGRAAVAAYLKKKRGYILVSHDRAFLNGCVDHVLSINRGGVEIVNGNYDAWESARQNVDAFERRQNEKLGKQITDLKRAARRAEGWSGEAEKSKFHVHESDCAAVDRGYIGAKSAKMMKRAKAIARRAESAATEKESLLTNVERVDALKIPSLDWVKETVVFAKDFSVCYNGKPAFAPVSFTLCRGERLAVSGHNGCGKTSLLGAIDGLKCDYVGQLVRSDGLVVSVLSQTSDAVRGKIEAFFDGEKTDENLFRAILAKLEVRAESLTGDLALCSLGQKKKLLLARSLSTRAHLYLWDEPLNDIDLISRRQIEDMLAASSATMIFVEHDSAFVNKVATSVLTLKKSDGD